MSLIKQSLAFLLVLISLTVISCTRAGINKSDTDKRTDALLSRMTLDEKIGQMSQLDRGFFADEEQLKQAVREGRCGSLLNYLGVEDVNGIQKIAVEESRLGIPIIIGRDVIHGFRTVFPIPLGMAASWNPEIVREAFRISAFEAS